ncbi:hypothetical protein L1I30_07635 [Gillisia sp. M10.2A]|uniref:Carboxypeptidase regulatory-like domain-containing protein n=1 Tax=Gillisia lutea TaxID=2909668 RepID=A0ABS9EF72_9FLAO|nr:hypothetical protein [Gillisia lutea]MCF4101532.1 hypothetical protein [Gillisia lutea]
MRHKYPACFFQYIFYLLGRVTLLLLLFSIGIPTVKAQGYPEYDELTVDLKIPNYGVLDLPIAIKNEDAYIGVTELFNHLKIKNTKESSGNVITGFLINSGFKYKIDPTSKSILYKDVTYPASDAFIVTPTTTYLKSDYFGKIFEINTDFNFRNLEVVLQTELELPLLKEIRLRKMRSNLDNVKGIVKPDTTIAKTYPFFKAGMLDWGITTTQQSISENDNRFNLGLGTIIAGGETNVLLNYSTQVPFISRNQFYQWRYVNNSNSVFKQITAGKIFTRSTSSLFAPVVGLQLSNAPVHNRRSFGSYTLSDYTEPRWTVELYINNILVDFVEADASGFYTFDVPLMYGNTAVNLKFYGPNGEERFEEKSINIPYNFIPKNEFEYTLSAGIVEDGDNRKFSRLNLNYGITNGLTIGGGAEYVSNTASGEVIPFINTSIKLAPSFLFTGEYSYGVKAEGLLSYRTLSSFQVDFSYINYDRDQTAINYNYLEERKLTISTPIRTKFFTAYTRFGLNQIIMPTSEFTTAQLLLSGVVMGVSTNLTTYGLFNDRSVDPTIYSILSQTYRLPYQFLFSPQIQYDYNTSELTNMRVELERPVFRRGFLNLSYENNLQRNLYNLEIGLRYIFDFAQTAVVSRFGNKNSSFVQSARGSLRLDDNTGSLSVSDRNSAGKGSINILPFLDLNSNGKMDDSEPEVPNVHLKNNLGAVSYNKNETIINITDLQPYTNLVIEIDTLSVDNIAWRIKNPRISVETVPNQFKNIYVPIHVVGEVSGMVYLKNESGTNGLGRIIINILDSNQEVIANILTEGDGYFSYLGLPPGTYKAKLNENQLSNLGYFSKTSEVSFEIEIDKYGDIVDTIEFVIQSN